MVDLNNPVRIGNSTEGQMAFMQTLFPDAVPQRSSIARLGEDAGQTAYNALQNYFDSMDANQTVLLPMHYSDRAVDAAKDVYTPLTAGQISDYISNAGVGSLSNLRPYSDFGGGVRFSDIWSYLRPATFEKNQYGIPTVPTNVDAGGSAMVPSVLETDNGYTYLSDQDRLDRGAEYSKWAARDKMGGFGRAVGGFLKMAVPAAIGTVATAGLGSALGGLGGLGGATSAGTAAGTAGSSGLGSLGSLLGSSTLKGAALGALPGALQGDIKGALTGAVLGGAGGYLTGGGSVPGLGSMGTGGTVSAGGVPIPGIKPTGILGSVSKGLSSLGSLASPISTGGNPMKLGSLLQAGGDIYGYFQSKNDLKDMERMLAQSSAQAQSRFLPYSQAGEQALASMQAPGMEALENDPGYQFRLQQGQKALERSLAARGLGQSGAALKAAQEYGQGLASQTYDDFYNRQAQLANMGYGAASGLGSLDIGMGDARAAAMRAQLENRNRLLSGLGGLFG